MVMAVGSGLALLILLGIGFTQSFERAVVEINQPSPGGTNAYVLATLGPWAAYATRAWLHLRTDQ